nr:hypothetical protein HK105_006184 [Polyrhizophydium stewartii]
MVDSNEGSYRCTVRFHPSCLWAGYRLDADAIAQYKLSQGPWICPKQHTGGVLIPLSQSKTLVNQLIARAHQSIGASWSPSDPVNSERRKFPGEGKKNSWKVKKVRRSYSATSRMDRPKRSLSRAKYVDLFADGDENSGEQNSDDDERIDDDGDSAEELLEDSRGVDSFQSQHSSQSRPRRLIGVFVPRKKVCLVPAPASIAHVNGAAVAAGAAPAAQADPEVALAGGELVDSPKAAMHKHSADLAALDVANEALDNVATVASSSEPEIQTGATKPSQEAAETSAGECGAV